MSKEKDNSGALFREAEKKSERAPDYTGRATVAGRTWRIAGWLRESAAGKKYLSLAFSKPDASEPAHGGGDLNDEIPFGPCWQ